MKKINVYLDGANWHVGDFYETEDGIRGLIDLDLKILFSYPLPALLWSLWDVLWYEKCKLCDNEFVSLIIECSKEELKEHYELYMKDYLKSIRKIEKAQKKFRSKLYV